MVGDVFLLLGGMKFVRVGYLALICSPSLQKGNGDS